MDADVRELTDENRHLKEYIMFLEQHDTLTGLLNLQVYFKEINSLLKQEPEIEFSLICFSIKSLKLMNLQHSNQYADSFLCHIANYLKYPEEGIEYFLVSRVYADTFSVFLPQSREQRMIAQILLAFSNFSVTMSAPHIGIRHVKGPELEAYQLLNQAMMAASSIYGNAEQHIAVYGGSLFNDYLLEQTILTGFEAALSNREFQLYLQPKYNMFTKKIIGAEALIRWFHPTEGLIPPGKFIPILEQYNLIQELDCYMWDALCCWLHNWIERGHTPLPVSVNASRISICSMEVPDILNSLISKYELEPYLLEVEITESAYAEHSEAIKKTVEKLHQSGFTVLMDDFGSGYSSLSLLADTDIDILKLDMRFLSCDTPKSNYILSTVIRMSYWLNLRIIAEGVENQQQADTLRQMGCLYAQGFLYSKAIPSQEFESLIADDDSADFMDHGGKGERRNCLVSSYELFNQNMLNEQMAERLIGSIIVFSLEKDQIRILNVNEAFCMLFQLDDVPCQGEDLLHIIAPEDSKFLLDICHRTAELNTSSGEIFYLRTGIAPYNIKMHLYCLTKKPNSSILYAHISNATELFKALDKMRLSEQRFQIAANSMNHTMVMDIDIRTHMVQCSASASIVLGLSASCLAAPEGFLEQGIVCKGYEAAFCHTFLLIYSGNPKAECTLQIRMADGLIRNIRLTIIAIPDLDGSLTSAAVGIIEPVEKQ